MNVGLIISIVVIAVALLGLVSRPLKSREYSVEFRRRVTILLLIGLVAGLMHGILDAGVIQHSTVVDNVLLVVELGFFALLLFELVRVKRSQRIS